MRIICVVLVGSLALFHVMAALGNFIGFDGLVGIVGRTMSMGEGANWHAVTSPLMHQIVAAALLLAQGLIMVACGLGAWRLFAARGASSAAFAQSKRLALFGLGLMAAFYLLAWMVFAAEWFRLIVAPQGHDLLSSAFWYVGEASFVMLWVRACD